MKEISTTGSVDGGGIYRVEYETGHTERVPHSDLQIMIANGESQRQAQLAYDKDICQVCLRGDEGESRMLAVCGSGLAGVRKRCPCPPTVDGGRHRCGEGWGCSLACWGCADPPLRPVRLFACDGFAVCRRVSMPCPDPFVLLCDHPLCDAGYHTFCLDPPLSAVWRPRRVVPPPLPPPARPPAPLCPTRLFSTEGDCSALTAGRPLCVGAVALSSPCLLSCRSRRVTGSARPASAPSSKRCRSGAWTSCRRRTPLRRPLLVRLARALRRMCMMTHRVFVSMADGWLVGLHVPCLSLHVLGLHFGFGWWQGSTMESWRP
jgi:hypothetical protein